MKRYGLLILLCFTSVISFAQESDYEIYLREQKAAADGFKKDYMKGVMKSAEEYEAFKKKWEDEFNNFKKDQTKRWGDFKERDKKTWVEYKETGKLRSTVDFEKGKATVEVIAETPAEVEKAKREMAEKILETFQTKPTQQGFEPQDKSLENPPVMEKPALKDQIETEGKPLKEVAENLAKNEVKTKEVKGEDGETRTVVYVDFSLAPDHLRTRAESVEEFVYRFSKQYDLDPAMVFAIIHTESYYNPTAKSPANAHGLMQLVPTSGGRDAYKKAYKKDGIPTPEFLYNPENNVMLGSQYFEILNNAYFKNVNSKVTRDYLSICAYNTGAGNVAKAYTGTTSPSKAMPEINKRTDQENYDLLIQKLPYEETRNYLKKVHERRTMYLEWMKNKDIVVE